MNVYNTGKVKIGLLYQRRLRPDQAIALDGPHTDGADHAVSIVGGTIFVAIVTLIALGVM